MKNKKVLAFYIRLSMEDFDKRSGGADESASVHNQRDLLWNAYHVRPELSEYEVAEYVDDGFSGTNFARPSFQRMMEDVRKGKIGVIMVKDLSRFARNFLDAGEYLEQIFPFLGVRFISVNDGYDSEKEDMTAGNWSVEFKNFLYDLYSKDLSKKTTSAKKSKARQGAYMGRAPIGYVRSQTRKNYLEIEPEGAKIVRHIFDMALAGSTIPEITKALNDEGIPTPGMIAERVHTGKTICRRKNENVICWQYYMVSSILKNRVYTGACVNFKRSKVVPCGTQTRKNSDEDVIVVPGCHEAIVTEQEFLEARERVKIMKQTRNRKHENRPRRTTLSGFVRCGYCNKIMAYVWYATKPDTFACYTTRHLDKPLTENTCDCREYPVSEIERVVLDAIRGICIQAGKRYDELCEGRRRRESVLAGVETEIRRLRQKVMQKKAEKQERYEQYIMGGIDRSRFVSIKDAVDESVRDMEAQIAELEKQVVLHQTSDDNVLQELNRLIPFASAEKLTEEMLKALVKEVKVYRDSRYEIVWNFSDVFQRELMG